MPAFRTLLLLGSLTLLAACGSPTTPRSPFAGRWTGTFHFTPSTPSLSEATGMVEITVDDEGDLSGDVTLSTGARASHLEGTLTRDGELRANLDQFLLTGRLLIAPNGRARGSASQWVNGAVIGTVQLQLAQP